MNFNNVIREYRLKRLKYLTGQLNMSDLRLRRFQQALSSLECIILGKASDYILWRKKKLLIFIIEEKAKIYRDVDHVEPLQYRLFEYEEESWPSKDE